MGVFRGTISHFTLKTLDSRLGTPPLQETRAGAAHEAYGTHGEFSEPGFVTWRSAHEPMGAIM